jgi:tRNA(Arg) A34 adenosine deaminase TadA
MVRVVNEAAEAWTALSEPWRVAFEEAWTSWRRGSLGVGAVVTEGEDIIVARGHNQMRHSGPGPISETYMAHAEMNALAQLPVRRGPDYRIYSTFEPCYMCTSALLLYRVNQVYFAAPDPVWEGTHDWLNAAPFASLRQTSRECLGGELGAFGHLLHISRLAPHAPPHVVEAHLRSAGQLFQVATEASIVDSLSELEDGDAVSSACDALTVAWDDLVRLRL